MNTLTRDSTRQTILIVDDQPSNLRLLATMLKEHGYNVNTVTNGSMAIESVMLYTPDIVLLDINLPDISGYEVCERLKAHELTSAIPVLFISALDDITDKLKGFTAGAVDYITKPFRLEEVLARVQTHLKLRMMQQQLEAQHHQLEAQHHQLQQEMQERQEVEKALRESQERFQLFVENARDIIFRYRFSNPRGFEYISPSVEQILGYTPEEYYADPNMDLKTLHPEHRVVFGVIAQSRDTYREPVTMRHLRKDGDDVWIEQNHWHITDETDKVVAIEGIARDITERKRAEDELRIAYAELERRVQERTAELSEANRILQTELTERARHERQREAVITVTAAMRTATTRTEMIAIFLEQVVSLLNADGVVIFINDMERGALVLEQGKGIWETLVGTTLSLESSIAGHILASGQPYLTNDARKDPTRVSLHLPGPVSALACIPLIAQEQSIALLCVGSQAAITDDDMRLLNALGDMAANALNRITLHEQTETRLQHVHALYTIDQTIITSRDLFLTLDVLLYQVTSQLHVDAAAIMLFNSETQGLDYTAGHGLLEADSLCHTLDSRYSERTPATNTNEALAGFDLSAFTFRYCIPLIARGSFRGVLEILRHAPLTPDQEWIHFLETLAGQASIAIDSADLFGQLQQKNIELVRSYDATIEGWARALELRDKETKGHCQRVTDLTVQLARRMGFTESDLIHIRRGAILHDIGKMAIPDSILLKNGPLTGEEYTIMQQHPVYAYNLLFPITFLRSALDIPYCHHEKWDGTGYPRGLEGTDIPLSARIFAVVDVWDALRFDRPYRKSWSKERVCAYIKEQTNSHFDPHVVEVFLEMIEEM